MTTSRSSQYIYEIWMRYEDTDWYGKRKLTESNLWYTATSLAQVARLVGWRSGQISYELSYQGDRTGWLRSKGGGIFQVIRKANV
jgi:hypothetical protein